MDLQNIYWYIFAIPSLLIASSIHEYSHAFVATKLGDYTAKAEGRLTLNPLKHIDIIGAMMMIVAGIGWSKPVPINERNFEKPILYTAFVAAAGPISNLIVATLFAILYHIFPNIIFFVFILVNLSLAVFNLLPLPPLDGHKITRAVLPKQIRYYWEKAELLIPIIFLLLVIPFSPLATFTQSIISNVLNFLLRILGIY